MVKRLFIERKNEYQIEAESLQKELSHLFGIPINTLSYYIIYDLLGFSEHDIEQTLFSVFAEINKDHVHHDLVIETPYIAYEYLPGQYDQRADSASQCVQLILNRNDFIIQTGTLLIFDDGISFEMIEKMKKHLINTVEAREKDLTKYAIETSIKPKPITRVFGFIDMPHAQLFDLYHSLNLAMNFDDFQFIQSYFKDKNRDPLISEIRILDTYWSDHCRHTTFETLLDDIHFEESVLTSYIEKSYQSYLQTRIQLHREDKPITLMDLATINARYEKQHGKLKDVEVSDEHNAASIMIDVDVDSISEPWLLMFKNETHNHPTEIEPFGGASTCIGGAIRDPLSGRSYVYGAMRITGAADITEPIEKTTQGKLPQRVISKKAAEGYSSYGNQIGLATTFVQEIFHEGYRAKRMEVGAVIGAVPQSYVKRKHPKPGDLILLIGGRTGRDGIGGATGSSKSHQTKSIDTSSSEVQKGNAVIERKIQRLFRNPEVTACIKKANDFGAGGVGVAIGELADCIHIELDKVPVKYDGLNPLEIAISESQERMAIVIDQRDEDFIKSLAYAENLEITTVARVTEEPVLLMTFHDEVICQIDRSFIDTSGVKQHQHVLVTNDKVDRLFHKDYPGKTEKDKILHMLDDLNITSLQGLVEMFDSTIGSTTVILPYGGVHQKTKAQASIQKLPIINGHTDSVSIMTYGFDPYLSEMSPYHGAMYAVIDSIAKVVASGGDYHNIHLSFQEYFEKLGKDSSKWGKPFKSLLGAYEIQKAFGLAAIGGKDSMSGTFEELHVPPTLISFAFSKDTVKNIISNAFVSQNAYLYLAKHRIKEDNMPNVIQLKSLYEFVHHGIENKTIVSSYALSFGGLSESLIKASFGNHIGCHVSTTLSLFDLDYGSIVVESMEIITHEDFIYLGKTHAKPTIQINDISLSIGDALNKNEQKLSELYPIVSEHHISIPFKEQPLEKEYSVFKHMAVDKVKVLLPIFPGTNCEYDSEKAFISAGAEVESFVFCNQTPYDVQTSIALFAHHIDHCHILMLSGGFSSGDEPDGSGKYIANVLKHPTIKDALNRLRERKGLILGICNGFQALIKSGLLPYGEITFLNENSPNLHKNLIKRHVSKIVKTKVTSSASPWLVGMKNEVHDVPVSHGEGRLTLSEDDLNQLIAHHQIAFQYVDFNQQPTYDPQYNPNGSTYAIEGIISEDGLILGKMGHSERVHPDLYKNFKPIPKQNIFINAVNYFKQRGTNHESSL